MAYMFCSSLFLTTIYYIFDTWKTKASMQIFIVESKKTLTWHGINIYHHQSFVNNPSFK